MRVERGEVRVVPLDQAHGTFSTRDAAPTEAGAVPCTSSPSDQACIFSTCWPRQAWIATARGMGDRRVGTWMPCQVRRFVGQDYA